MNLSKTVAVTVGTPVVFDLSGWPVPTTVTAIPGGGGTLAIEVSTTETAVSNPGAASWVAWPSGTVSARASNTLDGPVRAIRATATTAAGTLEVVS